MKKKQLKLLSDLRSDLEGAVLGNVNISIYLQNF